MSKIVFKRKKAGGGSNWGAGLDYLLKDMWEDLDILVEDNYYGRHNVKLIDSLFLKMADGLKKAKKEMKKLCVLESDKKMLEDWNKKAREIEKFGFKIKKRNEKVIFIDSVTQFLRETSVNGQNYIYPESNKKNQLIKKAEFKGTIACNAVKKIQGIVKVILQPGDFNKFKKGEILVTDETDASFLPIIRMAKGIITDTGGILCHAAIVARELKILCMTGTKMATNVLKDGDLVEVDAISGMVKILKRKE